MCKLSERVNKIINKISVMKRANLRIKNILRMFFLRHKLTQSHKSYGKIYLPIYNLKYEISSEEPVIYNRDGEAMRTFFIRDLHMAHNPYYSSKYFAWDRYNFALKTHFYTHNAMLETMGSPDYRYGWLLESEAIVPDDYNVFKKYKTLNKEFNSIFTYSDRILDTVDNAKFFPGCAETWYGKPIGGGKMSEDAYNRKTKNISIVSSDKVSCELHKYRIDLARKYKNDSSVDTFGTFDGGLPIKIGESLQDYRYSIVIENFISSYFFTERITNCFAAQTIPIYIGAAKIDDFFNTDGIIQIHPKDFSNIDKIIKQCCQEDYEQRIPAVKENYRRVQKYVNVLDYLYEEYLINDK